MVAVIIQPTKLGSRGQLYSVSFEGQTLIPQTRTPGYDACRALLAKGVTGRLDVYRGDSLAFSIPAEGAKWTITEDDRGIRRTRWKPHPQTLADVGASFGLQAS
jgi:hypothetical protein